MYEELQENIIGFYKVFSKKYKDCSMQRKFISTKINRYTLKIHYKESDDCFRTNTINEIIKNRYYYGDYRFIIETENFVFYYKMKRLD